MNSYTTYQHWSRLEAHAGVFKKLMKGIFDPYVLWPFDKKSDIIEEGYRGTDYAHLIDTGTPMSK